MSELDVTLKKSDTTVSIKRKSATRSVSANILGTEIRNNTEYVYLDRRLHRRSESTLGSYNCHGAISTILSKPLPIESAKQLEAMHEPIH